MTGSQLEGLTCSVLRMNNSHKQKKKPGVLEGLFHFHVFFVFDNYLHVFGFLRISVGYAHPNPCHHAVATVYQSAVSLSKELG